MNKFIHLFLVIASYFFYFKNNVCVKDAVAFF